MKKSRFAALVLSVIPALVFLTGSAQAFAQSPTDGASVRNLNTPREFPAISSRNAWQKRARQIRQQVLVSCGLWPMPEKTPLNAHIFGKIDRAGYSIEKVYFETYSGFYLAGNLYRPTGRGKGPFPAILNPHGHWGNGRMADEKDGSIAARCISFARQGMIALSYDMVGYNDTHFADTPTNRSFSEVHHQFATNPICSGTSASWDCKPGTASAPWIFLSPCPTPIAGDWRARGNRAVALKRSCWGRWMIGWPRKRRW